MSIVSRNKIKKIFKNFYGILNFGWEKYGKHKNNIQKQNCDKNCTANKFDNCT